MKKFTRKGNPLLKCWIGQAVYTKEYNTNDDMQRSINEMIDNPNLCFVQMEDEYGIEIFVNFRNIDAFTFVWREE